LAEHSEIVSQLQSLRDIVSAERSWKKQNVPTMERSSANNKYMNVYSSPEYYWEKCFPTLYPYGHGGPSDRFFRMKNLQTYFAHVLRRGGGMDGRRFQTNPSYMFVCYTYETKRRVKNMAYAATREDSANTTKSLTSQMVVSTLVDCLTQSENDEAVEIDELYKRVKEKRSNDTTTTTNTSTTSSTIPSNTENVINDEEVLLQVKKLMQRLVPFAQQTTGTPMQMKLERLNMLAMTTSSFILSYAQWRWFATFAFPDKQDSRVYENVIPMGCDFTDWQEREEIVRNYSGSIRAKLLRDHPAIVARVFHEKQDCIWKCVLMGSDRPVGHVLDYMRRVEVSNF